MFKTPPIFLFHFPVNWYSNKGVILYTASPDISYFLGSADAAINIHLSILNYRKLQKILNFVLGQSLVHNKMPRSN